MGAKGTLFTIVTLLSASGHGAEIDSFTPRFKKFPDGLPAINREVNKRIGKALEMANQVSSCNPLILEALLGGQLLSPFYGQIENYANTSENVPRFRVLIDDSIYRNLPQFNFMLMSIGESLFGFGNVIHENRLLIGTDKFGHFFDEGHRFYGDLNSEATNLDEVLGQSESTEEGIYGRAVGGVKSYADLVANYHGMHFWSEMLQAKFKTGRRYLKCVHEHWVQIRQFNFRDYVDPGWDEGVNCSEYQSPEYELAVMSTIATLPYEDVRPSRCPVYPEECPTITHKYGRLAPRLIGPKCRTTKEE
ncbi:MAG: hypothetical protein A2X86_13160 [Bdellovibrionales bacterium GWA2_49_15]|nr:MAG: hypothetical protein A2X86_13160 [Bdellovibrionales bacterium GWA2_49_15]HAZ13472.1 hypothetical protein [Bdellovibrionales bacterium]